MQLTSQTVVLEKCIEYKKTALMTALDSQVLQSGLAINLHSADLMLKPNLISVSKGPLACTEGSFIVAVATWFLDQGARVHIGDSSVFGTARSVLKTIGVLDRLEHMGVKISNFKKKRTLVLSSGVKAGLAVDALDCDLLVNLPRVKAHGQFLVTLAVKNYFGCLVGMHKPWWHMYHGGHKGIFESLLVQLLDVLPDSITLIDGIRAMHVTGPLNGEPFQLGLLGCSINPVALDSAILCILDIPPEKSPLWLTCQKKKIIGTDYHDLTFPLLKPSDFSVLGFQVPPTLLPIRFQLFRFARNAFKRFFHNFR